MREKEWVCRVEYGPFGGFKLYLIRWYGEKGYCHTFDNNGMAVSTEFDPLSAAPISDLEPLIVVSEQFGGHKMFQAIAEGLKEAGFVAEVDNKKRIAAQALADEREKELDYFKGLNEKLIMKMPMTIQEPVIVERETGSRDRND